MPKVTFLPNPELCPDGITVTAKEGDTICRIALDNNIPILPVVIAGTGDIWPKGKKFMTSGKAIINTLEPIDMSKYTKETIDQLVEDTYQKMYEVYKELTASIK